MQNRVLSKGEPGGTDRKEDELAAAAARARLRVDVAKQNVRLAKEEFKRARKRFKEAKREAKRARRRAAEARKALKRSRRRSGRRTSTGAELHAGTGAVRRLRKPRGRRGNGAASASRRH